MRSNLVPVFLQHDSSDCGLAAIKMVSGHLGVDVDFEYLRKRYLPSKNGLTFKDMIFVCKGIGLTAKAFKANSEHLKEMNLPCILHWNMNHYVVLERVESDQFTIVDPALGRRTISDEKFKESFTGIILYIELNRKLNNDKIVGSNSKWYDDFFIINNDILKPLFVIFLIDILMLLSPLLIKNIINESYRYGYSYKFILFLLICFSFTLLINKLSRVINNKVFNISLVSSLSANDLHIDNLLRKNIQFFTRRTISDILNTSDNISKSSNILQKEIPKIVSYSLTIIVFLFIFAYFNFMLFILSLAFSALLIFSFITKSKTILTNNNDKIYYESQARIIHSEIIKNIKTHRISNTLTIYASKLLNLKNESLVCQANLENGFNRIGTDYYLYSSMFRIILYSFVGFNLNNGTLLNSEALFLIIGFEIFASRLYLVAHLTQSILLSLPYIKKSSSILDNSDNEDNFDIINEDIEDISICDGYYRHSIFENYVLKNINVTINKDKFHVIFGPSGAGKSTLLDILTDSIELTQGKKLVNKSDDKRYITGILRSNSSSIFQTDTLSTGTILDNICSFDHNPDIIFVTEICDNLGLTEVLNKNPLGLHCFVFDGGKNFSGGERQKILLARAIYNKPKIIFLDEATSALDIESEKLIHLYLSRLKITRVVISHRKEILHLADSHILVENGTVYQTFK
ncbi:cysteine peptidase family C39 domain-containing protein [Vibrio parahaemolyticus]|uniref:peptidase domain-containing ABC transporter n=1 Tax=Vibrio parahaemolyticus TaxID=670 RepID=UPI001EFC4CEA|nr:cysteine peptidase family C39 domain-containing protein [Vibrio parahaemolyticus]MCG9635034.1 cysteine peptidase family C39 domain-containing protein [Vibrio parahaemolyticus]